MKARDLAALAALGAMGYMYKRHLDGQGAEAGPAAAAGPNDMRRYERPERFAPFADVGTGGAGGVGVGTGVGTAGVDKRSDADDFAKGTGIQERGGNEQRYRDYRGSGSAGVLGETSVGSPFANSGSGTGTGSAAGTIRAERFAPYPEVGAGGAGGMGAVVPDAAPEESGGIGGAGLAAAGAGAAGAGAAAYYAKVKRQARLADEARAKMKAAAQQDILKDRAQAGVDEDRDARARAQNEADRVAKAQAQADAETKSRMIQAEIDSELKRLKGKTKGADARADVSKAAFAAGPTVTRETSAQKRTPVKVEVPTDMDDFNRMLRESKVGRATTTTTPAAKTPKVRNLPGKLGLAATALGLGTAANAATDMTAGQRERLAKDVMEGLVTPLGLTPGMAGEGSELYPSKPLSSAERKKMIEAMSPADRKKMQEALARQNPGMFDGFKRPSAANKRAAGGQIKIKRMASGGMTSTMSSASKRGDGIASKGKTRCKMY